jgi:tRNA threonylcarbamoyladenosine biosynthesis protein TsaE
MDDGMSASEIELNLADAEATDALGVALAQALPGAGRGCAVLYLRGELGAGKTTCARSLLRVLGVGGLIRSPTFTLLESYQLGAVTCIHVDLYRLHSPVEVVELGLRDFLNPGCLLLIEWPEKGGDLLPAADLDLTLEYAHGGRRAALRARTAFGIKWLDILQRNTRLASYVPNLT